MNVKLELQQCPYIDTMERRNHEEVFKDLFFSGDHAVFFDYHVLLLCGRNTGKRKRSSDLYDVSGRSVDTVSDFYLRMHSLHHLPQKKTG